MEPQIEANSLSDITQLASNPPKYPRNPTAHRRDPLTLYIAKVPGSRDVILTTLKPQLKNITAEDIASSLYFFHLQTEEDAQLLTESDTLFEEEENETKHDLPSLPRKPLPESSRASIDVNPQPSNLPPPTFKRKALPTEKSLPQAPRIQSESPISRRPLGPRPLATESHVARKPLPGSENQPLSSQESSITTPPTTTRVQHLNHLTSELTISDAPADPRNKNKFTVTIIRRDPSSGAQWNIGTIIGEEQERSPTSSTPRKPYFDISIHITTPGYVRFRDSKAPCGGAGLAPSIPDRNPHKTEDEFTREVRMEGSSVWERSKQHRRMQSDALRGIGTNRRRSNSDTPSLKRLDGAELAHDRADTHELEPKGYVFKSLWDGRCKFSTSSSGRSLRCRHTLPEPVSATNTDDSRHTSATSAVVSELRFNLPSFGVFHNATTPNVLRNRIAESGRFQIPKFNQIREKLALDKMRRPELPPRPPPTSYAAVYPSDDERPPLPPRPQSSDGPGFGSHKTQPFPYVAKSASEDEDDDDRLDLSLGQEKAGGGNRGKRAKLGKLIIYDEGFKMLDLAIAANMGVWWSIFHLSSDREDHS